MRAKIDDVHMFQQVLDEKRDPRAVLKEAISNAYDAHAKTVEITLTRRSERELDLVIRDDGDGLTRAAIRRFFDLGFSRKGEREEIADHAIGQKGLGSKLILNSKRVTLRSRDEAGGQWCATLHDAREKLTEGELPTYIIEPAEWSTRGTEVLIERYQTGGSTRPFEDEHLVPYLRWFTAAGQATRHFGRGNARLGAVVEWRHFPRSGGSVEVRGHELPRDSAAGQPYARTFDPFSFELRDYRGVCVGVVDVAGAVLESDAHLIQNRLLRKPFKGFFFCKDDFAIRAVNAEIAGGTGVWQNFHVMINCQALELGASREDFTNSSEGSSFATLVEAIREFLRCARRGVPFAYRGTLIEGRSNFAGAAYEELQAKKRKDRHRRQGEALALDLVGLSRRRKTTLGGTPHFEPEDEIGTLAWFQSLVLHPSSRGRFELLHATGARGGTVIVREKSDRHTTTYALGLHCFATERTVSDALNAGLDGIIAWNYVGENLTKAKVIVLRNLVKEYAIIG